MPCLPIQRAVVGVLGHDHLGQQPRGRHAALDRARGGRQLDHPGAVRAGELGAHMPEDLEVAGDEIEQLGDVFAELAHRRPAVGTGAARRARARWSRAAGVRARPAAHGAAASAELLGAVVGRFLERQGCLVEGLCIGGQLQIIERELQLHECCVHALGGATEAPALESRDLGQQLGDGLVASEHQTLERFDIIG